MTTWELASPDRLEWLAGDRVRTGGGKKGMQCDGLDCSTGMA